MRPQAGGAETSAAADGVEDLAALAALDDGDADARAGAEAIRLHAGQVQLDPVVAVAGILVEREPELVAGIDASHVLDDVLIAGVVDVAEGNPVSLL